MAAKTITIGAYSRNGLYQIVDTDRDINSTITVTVRETSGETNLTPARLTAMRKFALRAVPEQYEGQVMSATTVRTWFSNGYSRATFAVSRQAQ